MEEDSGTWVVLIVLFVIGLLFYWFELRPSAIKKDCSGFAERTAADAVRSKSMDYYSSQRIALYEDTYKECLRDRGL